MYRAEFHTVIILVCYGGIPAGEGIYGHIYGQYDGIEKPKPGKVGKEFLNRL
jgi:hypothetical protein